MTSRKRNEFLDIDDSEDDLDNGYDSDAAAESKAALTARSTKRRKTHDESDDGSVDGEHSDEDDNDANPDAAFEAFQESLRSHDAASPPADNNDDGLQQPDDEEPDEDADTAAVTLPSTHSATHLKPSTPKQVAAAEKALRKSGVIYISRVPPFMKPQTLRHFLTPHANKGLGRIFLTPEDHTTHVQRVKRGGNKKKSFTDGWVEFTSKAEAKVAAELLNGNIIGGKKGNFYHDDLWNIKYLKGFKWQHLTEQIANENAERAARMREEIRRTRKENKAFLEDVERGKMLDGMERKAGSRKGGGGEKVARRGMEFKQRQVQDKRKVDANGGQQPPELQRVLKGIF